MRILFVSEILEQPLFDLKIEKAKALDLYLPNFMHCAAATSLANCMIKQVYRYPY